MNPDLINIARTNPEAFSEMKEFTLDHMAGGNVVNPEEAFILMDADVSRRLLSDLQKAQDEMYLKFWEKVNSVLPPDAFVKFIGIMHRELGDDFLPGLETYIRKHYGPAFSNVPSTLVSDE